MTATVPGSSSCLGLVEQYIARYSPKYSILIALLIAVRTLAGDDAECTITSMSSTFSHVGIDLLSSYKIWWTFYQYMLAFNRI